MIRTTTTFIDGGGENLAGERRAASAERDTSDGVIEVQLAAVLGCVADSVEVDYEVAESLIGRHPPWNGNDSLLGKRFGLCYLPLRQQAAHLGNRLSRARIDSIQLLPCPNGVFIELQTFVAHAAKHHRAETAAADRQRLIPVRGGRAIPQNVRAVCWRPLPRRTHHGQCEERRDHQMPFHLCCSS